MIFFDAANINRKMPETNKNRQFLIFTDGNNRNIHDIRL